MNGFSSNVNNNSKDNWSNCLWHLDRLCGCLFQLIKVNIPLGWALVAKDLKYWLLH